MLIYDRNERKGKVAMFREFDPTSDDDQEELEIEGALKHEPDSKHCEGMVMAISPRRLYGILLTEADERLPFDLPQGSTVKVGDWLIFEREVGQFRNRAVNIKWDFDKDTFERMSL
jgi:hypothetical protein